MKYFCIIALLSTWAVNAQAGSVLIENKTSKKIKVSSIGGSGYVDAKSTRTLSFKNDENAADINIWWVKNARELCQIYTPWDRTITVSGKYTIQCLSRK